MIDARTEALMERLAAMEPPDILRLIDWTAVREEFESMPIGKAIFPPGWPMSKKDGVLPRSNVAVRMPSGAAVPRRGHADTGKKTAP
jgi:hypothetical protein